MEGETSTTNRMVGVCRHDDDGVCHLHGGEATRRWKPEMTIVEEDGRKTRKMGRRYFHVCDVAPEGGRRPIQTRLSFARTTIPNQ